MRPRLMSALAAAAILGCSGGSAGVSQVDALPTATQPAIETPASTATVAAPTATTIPPAPTATPTPPPSPTPSPPTSTPAPVVTEVAPPPAPPPPPSGPTSVTVHATNFTFSPDSIQVTSGATVTVHFVNDDRGVSHNIAFALPEVHFTTPCTGSCTADLTFTAPAPGQYAFSCSVHPYMTGTLIAR